ncbi:hypothetical protein PCANC_06450 [Puccinia coronata f. sp. avenae]|uniref:Uncharacterized protein n=1 Tax=Puccinia coronata f. sp. avenae TaxID=200324 RepID=A0A2N5VVW7_9BASI|nr:hypothetical protein PCANC_06450 [Puccinia coronata f. sp. avenae]
MIIRILSMIEQRTWRNKAQGYRVEGVERKPSVSRHPHRTTASLFTGTNSSLFTTSCKNTAQTHQVFQASKAENFPGTQVDGGVEAEYPPPLKTRDVLMNHEGGTWALDRSSTHQSLAKAIGQRLGASGNGSLRLPLPDEPIANFVQRGLTVDYNRVVTSWLLRIHHNVCSMTLCICNKSIYDDVGIHAGYHKSVVKKLSPQLAPLAIRGDGIVRGWSRLSLTNAFRSRFAQEVSP